MRHLLLRHSGHSPYSRFLQTHRYRNTILRGQTRFSVHKRSDNYRRFAQYHRWNRRAKGARGYPRFHLSLSCPLPYTGCSTDRLHLQSHPYCPLLRFRQNRSPFPLHSKQNLPLRFRHRGVSLRPSSPAYFLFHLNQSCHLRGAPWFRWIFPG